MNKKNWKDVARDVQKLHVFARTILIQQKTRTLTAAEMEVISYIHLSGEKQNPRSISNSTGMKKESVSRCLKTLFEREIVKKEKNIEDERSYWITLTDRGLEELDQNYKILLSPYHYLKERMGKEYESLIQNSIQATEILQEYMNKSDK